MLSVSKNLVNQELLEVLIASGADAEIVARGLLAMRDSDLNLMNERNFRALIESKENIGAVAVGLCALYRANLLTQENFDLLFDSNQNEDGRREPILLTSQNFRDLFSTDEESESGILLPHKEEHNDLLPPPSSSSSIPETDIAWFPSRRLPSPLTQESFERFIETFMAAKYFPGSKIIKTMEIAKENERIKREEREKIRH